MFAYADIPEPPIPTKYSRPAARVGSARSSGRRTSVDRHRPRGERDQLVGDDVRRVGAREREHRRRASHARRSGSASSSATSAGTRSTSASGTTIAPPPALEVAGVERLVVGGRVRVRDEDRRRPRRRELPHGPAGAGDGEVGRRERLAEVVGLRRAARSRAARRAGAGVSKSRSPQMCRTAGPVGAPRLDRHLVERPRPGERAEDGDHGPVRGEPEAAHAPPRGSRRDARAGSGGRRRAPSRRLAPGSRRRGTAGGRTAPRAGWRARGARRPRSAPPGSRAAVRRAPSGRRRSRRAPSTTSGRRRARIAQAVGRARPTRARRREAGPRSDVRGRPETGNVSSAKPASGTSRDSTRSGVPANVTVTPRSRSASPTASAGRT